MSKSEPIAIHPIRRAKERYRVEMTLQDLQEIETMISTLAEGVKLQSVTTEDRAIWWVPFKGKRLRVVFDAECKRVVTILPLRSKGITTGHRDRGLKQSDNAFGKRLKLTVQRNMKEEDHAE